MNKECRYGDICPHYSKGKCWFIHPEKTIGGFPISMLKAEARSTMNDEKYNEFVNACDSGASENVISMMLFLADREKALCQEITRCKVCNQETMNACICNKCYGKCFKKFRVYMGYRDVYLLEDMLKIAQRENLGVIFGTNSNGIKEIGFKSIFDINYRMFDDQITVNISNSGCEFWNVFKLNMI